VRAYKDVDNSGDSTDDRCVARGILRIVLVFALLFALTGSDAARSAKTQQLRTILLLKSRPTACIERQGPENVVCSTRWDGPSYGPDLKGMKWHSFHCNWLACFAHPVDDYWSIGARGEPDWLYGSFSSCWYCSAQPDEPEQGLFDPEHGPLADLPLPGVFWDRTSSHSLRIERGTGIFAGAIGTGEIDCAHESVKAYSYTCLLTLEVRR
jgi:hypothetical protein